MSQLKWRNGIIHTVTGNGQPGFSKDGETAENNLLNGPAGLAIDSDDNIYIAEIFNHSIRKIDTATNIVTTIAGCGESGFSGDGGPAVEAKLSGPEGVFVDLQGNVFIADTWNQRIRKVDAKTGIITTIAGTGETGFGGDSKDGREALLNSPSGVVCDSMGNVYFNDYRNQRIRVINSEGIISTFVGNGETGFSGDGRPADLARINGVYGLAIDKKDNLYFVDSINFAVRKVNIPSGIITTVCGHGKPGTVVEFENVDTCCLGGYASPNDEMPGDVPHGLDISNDGHIIIADTGVNRIRVIDPVTNQIFSVAGNGERGYSGDHGLALQADITVHGVRVDSKNNLYFLDFLHHAIRKVTFQ